MVKKQTIYKTRDMKINKITAFFIASIMLIFAACEPIVDEEVLTNTTTADNVELVATQSTAGGCLLYTSDAADE